MDYNSNVFAGTDIMGKEKATIMTEHIKQYYEWQE